jgi:hypothetical protein
MYIQVLQSPRDGRVYLHLANEPTSLICHNHDRLMRRMREWGTPPMHLSTDPKPIDLNLLGHWYLADNWRVYLSNRFSPNQRLCRRPSQCSYQMNSIFANGLARVGGSFGVITALRLMTMSSVTTWQYVLRLCFGGILYALCGELFKSSRLDAAVPFLPWIFGKCKTAVNHSETTLFVRSWPSVVGVVAFTGRSRQLVTTCMRDHSVLKPSTR